KPLCYLENGVGYYSSGIFRPDGRLLAAREGADGSIALWDASTGKLMRKIAADCAVPWYSSSYCFSPDGQRLAWISENSRTLHILDLASGREPAGPRGEVALSEVLFAPNGKTL